MAVSQGVLKTFSPGDTAYTTVTNNTGETPALVYSGVLFSTSCQQKQFFADGTNWCVYTPATNTLDTWAATSGELPVDEQGNAPTLICTWRDRVLLSGLLFDPQNIFASACGNPYDFDYSGELVEGATEKALDTSIPALGKCHVTFGSFIL